MYVTSKNKYEGQWRTNFIIRIILEYLMDFQVQCISQHLTKRKHDKNIKKKNNDVMQSITKSQKKK